MPGPPAGAAIRRYPPLPSPRPTSDGRKAAGTAPQGGHPAATALRASAAPSSAAIPAADPSGVTEEAHRRARIDRAGTRTRHGPAPFSGGERRLGAGCARADASKEGDPSIGMRAVTAMAGRVSSLPDGRVAPSAAPARFEGACPLRSPRFTAPRSSALAGAGCAPDPGAGRSVAAARPSATRAMSAPPLREEPALPAKRAAFVSLRA